MNALGTWVGHLAAVVLMAGLAEMLMPPGRLQGYARAVLGLIVLLAVLTPLLNVLHQGVSWSLPDAAIPPATAVASEASLTRQVFAQMLSERAVSAAESVTGVAHATAQVVLLPAQGEAEPQIAAASVAVQAAGDVAATVATRVAAALGLDPSKVTVREVGRK
ncbi:MAG TPA: stage III sporulation protein AF [Bacillota bacterium]|nr:stage III sporulation protein AF [Bacillota bacterium]